MRSMYEGNKKSGRSYKGQKPSHISVKARGDRVPKNHFLDADITSQNQVGHKLTPLM